MRKSKKLSVILMLMGVLVLFTGCWGKKPNSANNQNVVGNTVEETKEDVQENGLTKSEEEKARKLAQDFTKLFQSIDYKTDTKETYKSWINMMDETSQVFHDEAYIESQIQSAKDSNEVYIVKEINITSASKIENVIYIELTFEADRQNSSDSDNGSRTVKGSLTINTDFKVTSYKFEKVKQ